MAIQQNLMALIAKENITQETLARTIRRTQGAVSQWINGSKPPSMASVRRICEAYGLSESDILSESEGLYAKLHGLAGAPSGAIAVKPSKSAFGNLNPEEEVRAVFAKNIKALRTKNNMTQQQMAEELDIAVQTVVKWEGGSIEKPRQKEVVNLIRAKFNVTEQELFGYADGLYAKIHGLTEDPAGAIAFRKLNPEEEERTVFAKNLKALREREEISQYRFAEEMGITQTTVSNWESAGKRPRSQKIIDLICSTYGVSEQELFGYEDGLYAKLHGLTEAPPGAIAVKPSEPAFVPVRVLGKVHAGVLDDEEQCDGMAELPASLFESHPRAFALMTTGTCMNRVIAQGEHVFVDPDMQPQSGSIVIAETEACEAIMRRWYMGSSKLMLSPDSYDEYEDLVFESGEASVKVLGVVFWHQAAKELD